MKAMGNIEQKLVGAKKRKFGTRHDHSMLFLSSPPPMKHLQILLDSKECETYVKKRSISTDSGIHTIFCEDDLNAGSGSKTTITPRRVSLRISMTKDKDKLKTQKMIEQFVKENSIGITDAQQLLPKVKLTKMTKAQTAAYTDDWNFLQKTIFSHDDFESAIKNRKVVQDDYIIKMKRVTTEGQVKEFYLKWKSNSILKLKNGWYTPNELGEIIQMMIDKNSNEYKKLKN